MTRIGWTFVLLMMTAASHTRAEEPRAPTEQGVLVLHSGGVIRGEITHNDHRYVVRDEKSEFDVSVGQVMLVCKSMHDAYEQQRRRMNRPTIESHLKLAAWCMRYDLLQEAAQELAAAREIDSRHPRLGLLERRLAVFREPRPPTSPVESAHAASQKQADELRVLESMAAKLPAGTVERFTRRVQPLLVNSCTTSGCHQAGCEQHFQLDRAVLHGLSNRRTTLRNLSATLALVNRDAPTESKLLSIPTELHGGVKPPLMGVRQEEHLAVMADFIALATGIPKAEATLAESDGASRALVTQSSPAPRTPTLLSMPTPAATMLAKRAEESIFDGMPPVRYGAEVDTWHPKDEFDPELFNRTFGTENSAAKVQPAGHQRTTGSLDEFGR